MENFDRIFYLDGLTPPPPPHTHIQGEHLWGTCWVVVWKSLCYWGLFDIFINFHHLASVSNHFCYLTPNWIRFPYHVIFIFLQRNCHWTLPIKAADLPLHKTCFSVSFAFKFLGISDVSKGYCTQFISNLGIQIYICAVPLLRSQEFLFKMCTAYRCTFTTCFDTVCG